jgi:hypothetical protein
VPLVLNATNNPNYGGNLINQKYSPLEHIVVEGNAADYRNLFAQRSGLLTAINAYPPNALNLYANWGTIIPVDNRAPLIVISSNRADWMQTILQNAANHGDFANGYLDPSTFVTGAVPWYAPERSGRRVYVVVHWTEYQYYVRMLVEFEQVIVIGFKFTVAEPALDIVGFGVSRYCALQLAIALGYRQAWAVDDNVVNVNGFPATLAPIEAFMPEGSAIWGISFNAATANTPRDALIRESTFAERNPDFAGTRPGLLQQVVLWNVALFRANHLNFCPLFVMSNEDTSISNFLRRNANDERIITAYKIIKAEPWSDGDENRGGTVFVPERRNRMLDIFNGAEANTPINPGGGEVALSRFIAETVLPVAHQPAATALAAQSRAIEQVMAAATAQGWYPASAFDPYDGNAIVDLRMINL